MSALDFQGFVGAPGTRAAWANGFPFERVKSPGTSTGGVTYSYAISIFIFYAFDFCIPGSPATWVCSSILALPYS